MNMIILPKKLAMLLAITFLLGSLWFVGFKLIVKKSDKVHFHANFALYIDGKRDDFKSNVFYEEVQSCSADGSDPRTRVHMHDEVNDVVHVHAKGVTWGHFFANLGYTLGNSSITTRTETLVDGVNGKKLTFILNGEPATLIANRLIADTDRLLINYGSESLADLQLRFTTVSHSADEVDKKQDPASCSGGKSEDAIWNRIKKAAW